MRFFYFLFLHLYLAGIHVAAVTSRKARLWITGRHRLFTKMEQAANADFKKNKAASLFWLHCASLGEYEQSRSILESVRNNYPNKRILLTFFSPSGYENCKSSPYADHVFYLPIPTPANVKRFLDIWNPDLVAFVRSEYWYTFMRALSERKVPMVVLSSIFRPRQYQFRISGLWFRRQLRRISCFFLQDEASATLLKKYDIDQHVVCGDTRFDRVKAISLKGVSMPNVARFANNSKVLVAGSTWPADEALLKNLISDPSLKMKYVVAPHEVCAARICQIEKMAPGRTVRYSDVTDTIPVTADVLILDTIGLLSKVYQYGDFAYVGGGFGKGIHNIMEPAAWGLPVFFGPNHEKFAEAKELIVRGGGQMVTNGGDLHAQVSEMLKNNQLHQRKAKICKDYVAEKSGATEAIMKHLKTWL